MFTWDHNLDTGIDEIDSQHRELVSMLAKLFDAMQAGAGASIIGEILTGLESYADQHFTIEEQLMQRTGYPDQPAHQAAHAIFRARVRALRDQFQQGSQGVLSVQVVLFLRNWLFDHIGRIDQQLGVYLLRQKAG